MQSMPAYKDGARIRSMAARPLISVTEVLHYTSKILCHVNTWNFSEKC